MDNWGFPNKVLGYRVSRVAEYSLLERINSALTYQRNALRKELGKYSDSYRIETASDLMQFVAFLDKPMAEILDVLKIPRAYNSSEFIELHGPTQYVNPVVQVRKVVPGLVGAPKGFNELVVQPMFNHLPNLPIMANLHIATLKELINGHNASLTLAVTD